MEAAQTKNTVLMASDGKTPLTAVIFFWQHCTNDSCEDACSLWVHVYVPQVITQARGRFTPSITAIKRCIEQLIDKQYLQRTDSSRDTYSYIA